MDSNLENPSKDEEDRLSSFPQSILTHILSFVPTKCAARTSILSKRWKFLFLSVPKLVFHENELPNHDAFIDFVNRRLMLCIDHTSIAEFRLKLPKLLRLSVINMWVVSLLFRNLKVLEIEELGDSDSTATPQCPPSEIFGWGTLEVLKLRGRKMVLKFPRSVIFPKLKVLDLDYLEMHSESESLRFDQQGYPLLEKLRLRLVRFNCSKDIDDKAFLGLLIFLCNLKTLEFAFKKPKLAKIDIDAPQLRQLNYDIWEVDNVSQVQLTFRKSEFLMFAELYSQYNPHDLHIEVLSKMSGVKDLNLYCLDARDLPYPLPHFANLTHLYLYQTGVESMLSVLRNAPKLEALVHQKSERDEGFASPTDVPLCLALELKQVRISKFESCESEVKLVSYFLQHGAVLESVTLENSEWSVSTLEELLNLPRCSPKCKIVLDKGSGN